MNEPVILLIEDNQDDKILTMRALKKCNLQSKVVIASDGVEALDYLFGNGSFSGRELPDVVLLDLKLPKVDGLEVLRRLREYRETEVVPVVVLSSSAEPSDRLSSYRLGANSYIRKPVDFSRFIEMIKLVETYWFGINEAPPRGMELKGIQP